MQILGYQNNRIHVVPETEEDRRILKKCLGVRKRSDKYYHSLEINWVNESLLGLRPSVTYARRDDVATSRMNPRLKDYQVDDVAKMLSLKHSLNRNRMGAGKTVEAIEYLRLSGFNRILLVVPKSVKEQWRRSFIEWWPEMGKHVYMDKEVPVSGPYVLITNYEKLYDQKTKQLRPIYRSTTWDCVIADEAHRIKNPKSTRTKMMNLIPCRHRVALTGTPILNKPNDLYSIFYWLDKYFVGGSYWNFVEKFCKIEESFWGKVISGVTEDPDSLQQLKDLLKELSVYSDIGKYDSAQQIKIPIAMTAQQTKLYKATVKNSIKELQSQGVSIANGMAKLLVLWQICSNPALYELKGGNPKFEWISEVLEDNPELNIVVFSRFARTIYALKEYLCSKNISCETYCGDDSGEQRDASRNKFASGDLRVLAGTIGAMGEGVDGLQHHCSTVVFIDREWNPEIVNQAIARVDRFGQREKVNVFHLVCEGVDEHVEKVNIDKMEDIIKILGGDAIENTST